MRHRLARVLCEKGYVIQLDTLAELGGQFPDDAWVFIGDAGDQVAATADTLDRAMESLPLIAYGQAPVMSRVLELLNGPCVGYIQWPCADAELWRSFGQLERRIPRRADAARQTARARRILAVLTDREQEIARGIARGLSTKEMAGPLGISPRTVEVHRGNILGKLEVKNMAGLVRLVVEAEHGPQD